MSALHDMMAPEWIRLKRVDGHLGALYHPQKRIVRFVTGGGTVDYKLALYDVHQPSEPQQQEQDA